jgi:hypothetical protein
VLQEWAKQVSNNHASQKMFVAAAAAGTSPQDSNNKLKVVYTVLTDCHDFHYTKEALEKAFQTVPQLAALVDPYPSHDRPYMTSADLLRCDDRLTYLAIVKGKCHRNIYSDNSSDKSNDDDDNKDDDDDDDDGNQLDDYNAGPLFLWNRHGRQERCSKTGPDRDLLLTRDMLEYLDTFHDFKVTSMTACFFYKKCAIFNDVFCNLIQQRATLKARHDEYLKWDATATTLSSPYAIQATFLKNIINRACGYFGVNHRRDATKTTCHLVPNKMTAPFHPACVEVNAAGHVGNTPYFVFFKHAANKALFPFLQKHGQQQPQRKTSNAALPLFVGIIEYGKLRLSQMLSFLEAHISSANMRHLYSHVDNLVLALATDTIQEAVEPSKLHSFNALKHLYFGGGRNSSNNTAAAAATAAPGTFKQEWSVGAEENWKFVTPMCQNWATLGNSSTSRRLKGGLNVSSPSSSATSSSSAADSSSSSSNSSSNVSTLESYQASCNLLDKLCVKVRRERRVNKIANRNTEIQTFVYNKL